MLPPTRCQNQLHFGVDAPPRRWQGVLSFNDIVDRMNLGFDRCHARVLENRYQRFAKFSKQLRRRPNICHHKTSVFLAGGNMVQAPLWFSLACGIQVLNDPVVLLRIHGWHAEHCEDGHVFLLLSNAKFRSLARALYALPSFDTTNVPQAQAHARSAVFRWLSPESRATLK